MIFAKGKTKSSIPETLKMVVALTRTLQLDASTKSKELEKNFVSDDASQSRCGMTKESEDKIVPRSFVPACVQAGTRLPKNNKVRRDDYRVPTEEFGLTFNFRHSFSNIIFIIFIIFLLTCYLPLWAQNKNPLKAKATVKNGALKLSADETVSKNRGEVIDAQGHVYLSYVTENGEVVESRSNFARYDEKKGVGELWGEPRAIWKQSDADDRQIQLNAERIVLSIDDSILTASGQVRVDQTSSTLNADQFRYDHVLKKMEAEGNRPLFTMRQSGQWVKIRAEKIAAWTEKKEIEFNRKVQGVVEFFEPIK